MPSGIFPELEEGLEEKYGLSEAIVVDCLPMSSRWSRI